MYYLFYLFSRIIMGNPFLAILLLITLYLIIDKRFIGLLPDLTRPWQRRKRLRQLKELAELRPFDSATQLELGMLLFEAGKAQDALPHLEKAAAKLDNHAAAQYYYGAACVELDQYAKGIEALEKAIAVRPEVQYGMPFVYLTRATLQLNKQVKAEATNSTDPSSPDGKERIDEWIATVMRFGNVETCYRMGLALQQAGLNEQARSMYQEAITIYSKSPAFTRRQTRRWYFRARSRISTVASK
jgi:tetratricopeptide (TPR) repeat protein